MAMSELSTELKKRYVDCQALAEGGMGFAYRAWDKKRSCEVVLKFIRQELFGKRSSTKRFSREVIALKKLDHKNIVDVYDFEENHNPPFFTMEFVDGESLAEIVERGPMPVRRLVEVIIPIVSAIAHCHQNGIIHRDIKPDNIVLSRDGLPKLIDFGLASAYGEDVQTQLTKTGEVLGTLDYLPPEVICGTKSDERSDVFQIGVVIYSAIAGKTPFSSDKVISFGRGLVPFEIPSLQKENKSVDEALDGIVSRSLAIDPDLRYQSAAKLGKALKNWYENSRPNKSPRARPLSDLGKAVRTAKVDAVTESKVVAKGRSKFIYFALLVLFLCLLPQLRRLAIESSEKPKLLASDTLRELKLKTISTLELRYVGPLTNKCQLTGLPGGNKVIDLSQGKALSRSNFALDVPLGRPLFKKAVITAVPLVEGKPVLVAQRRWVLSANDYLDDILAPLENMKSEMLTKLLQELASLSEQFPSNKTVEDGRAQVRSILRRHSLGDSDMEKIKENLPSLCKAPIYLGSELVERLYPLFLIDVALANEHRLVPPWGKTAHHFGVTFLAGNKHYQRKRPWQQICYRSVLHKNETVIGRHRKADWGSPKFPAIFLTSADTMNRFTIRSTLFQEVHRELPIFLFQRGEEKPSVPSGLTQRAKLQFFIPPHSAALQEAVFTMRVAGFVRGTQLQLKFNENSPIMLLNSASLAKHRWDINVALPINPRYLKSGNNICTITRDIIGAFDRSSDLLAIKYYSLWGLN